QRGTVVMTVSHAGLLFRNAPRGRSEGNFSRDNIAAIVVAYQGGLIQKRYHLRVKPYEGKSQVLLVGKSKALLEDVRARLTEGMGIESINAASRSLATSGHMDRVQ